MNINCQDCEELRRDTLPTRDLIFNFANLIQEISLGYSSLAWLEKRFYGAHTHTKLVM